MAVVLAFLGYSGIGEHGGSPAVDEQPAGVTLEGTSHSGGKDESPSKGSTAKGKRKTANRGNAHPAKHISFKEPIDFATGAIPPSTAFNLAAGDQLALQGTQTTLSDSMAVGDFNRDGKPDVVQTNVIAGSVSVFLGDGRGGFTRPLLSNEPVGMNPTFVVAGDLDLDGYLDLAVANYGSNNVVILRGNGGGGFLPAAAVQVPHPRNIAIGKFNDDDNPDLAVASKAPVCPPPAAGVCSGPISPIGPAGGTAVLTGNGDGTFGQTQFITHTHSHDNRPAGANHVEAGDFDGNGLDDLAVGVGTSRSAGDQQAGTTKLTGDDLLIFLNRNHPDQEPFNTTPDQPAIRVGAIPNAIAVADWNRDTHKDLAVMGNSSGDITTLMGDGRGHFEVKATNVTVGGLPRSLAIGDFNDDRTLDLATASFQVSTVSVLKGKGDGTFEPAVEFWSGDAPTGVAVGQFNDDRRLDLVAGRLRTDQLSLLLNDSPQPGDGVVIKRDIPYVDPTGDPFARHHRLDVYSPPRGTVSFAGRGRPYPVVFFAHGGGFIAGDKSASSYLMRSLALEGIVAVSTGYRLGATVADAEQDFVQAFRWTRDNVGSTEFGGDPDNMFVFGYSAGAFMAKALGTEERFGVEQKNIRGLVLAGPVPPERPGNAAKLPPSLLLNASEENQVEVIRYSVIWSEDAKLRGAESKQVTVLDRNHLTQTANMARADDPGRIELLTFMRAHV
jgi:acetyl esterase/lipase